MNLNLKIINKSGKSATVAAKKYAAFSFFVLVICAYSFLVFRISVLSGAEPSDDQTTEQAAIIKRLRLDQNSIDKIQQLEDQDVKVQSLFESARENPFEDQ